MRVATHDGVFHCDETLAYVIFSLAESKDTEIKFARTRDPKVIAKADVVFDVGGEYAPDRGRFDHHQKGGAGCRENGVPYAAAGLAWRHYGMAACRTFEEAVQGRMGDVDREELHAAVDVGIIQGVDALDTGALEGFRPSLTGQPSVPVRVHSLSALVSSFNPPWYIQPGAAEFDEGFADAALWLTKTFANLMIGECSRLQARNVVRAADTGRPVLVLEQGCPWRQVVVDELPHVRYVVYPGSGADAGWMVQAAPTAVDGFGMRRPLPAAWAGLRDGAFQLEVGHPAAVFCHPGRFICGAKTQGAALHLAEMALNAP